MGAFIWFAYWIIPPYYSILVLENLTAKAEYL